MSCLDNQSNINETFIIEPTFVGADTISACTSVFSNEFASCSGNTKFIMGTDVVTLGGSLFTNNNLSATTISATTYLNLPTDIRVTGGTYNAGVTTFTNNTGGTFTISGFSTGTTYFVGVIGNTPNASGATINNNILTLQPASSSFGGVMTTSAQTISGNKTWSGITSFENTVRVNNNNLFRLYDTGNVNNASIGFSQITYPTTFPILNFILNGASLGGFSQDGLQMVAKQTGYHVGGFNSSIFNNTNSNQTISFLTIGNVYSNITPLSGTNNFALISMQPNYVESGGTNTLRGLYYNPTFGTNLTGTTHIAFENVSGDIKLNSQSGTTTIGTLATGLVSPTTSGLTKMVIVDANGLLSTTIIPSGGTDTNITASTFSNNYFTLTNNTGGTLTTLIDNFTGLTVNGNISGTTYYILDQVNNDYSYLTSFGGGTNFYLANNVRIFGIAPQYIVIGGNGADEAMIYNILLTSSRSYNLPDKDGVFALVEDTLNSITGATFSNNYLTLTNNTGGTFTTLIDNFTGLTVNGDAIVERLIFESGGGYYIDSQSNIEFHNQSDDRFFLADDAGILIGNNTFPGTGRITVLTLTNDRDYVLPDKDGTFALLSDLSGFTTGGTGSDTYLTASTFNNNYLTLTNNTGGTLTTLIDNFTGLTVNGDITGTTYYLYDGPNDGYGSIGIVDSVFQATTYDNINLFRWEENVLTVGTGSTLYFNVGFTTPRMYIFPDKSGVIALTNDIITITGGTYSAGTLTLNTNSATTISISGFNTTNSFTGGTVSGATIFTGGLTANTISATTYLNLPTDIRVTGGTYTAGTTTFVNNTGGTFTISGFSTGTTDTNFANTNLTANQDRTHDWSGYQLSVENLSGFSITNELAYTAFTAYNGGTMSFSNDTIFNQQYATIPNQPTNDNLIFSLDVNGSAGTYTFLFDVDNGDGTSGYYRDGFLPDVTTCLGFYGIITGTPVNVVIQVEKTNVTFDDTIDLAYFDGNNLKKANWSGIDTLQSVTNRGSRTTNQISVSGGEGGNQMYVEGYNNGSTIRSISSLSYSPSAYGLRPKMALSIGTIDNVTTSSFMIDNGFDAYGTLFQRATESGTTLGLLFSGHPTTNYLSNVPLGDGTLALSVNGVKADRSGNIVISTGGTGSGTYLTASTFSNNYLTLSNNTGGTLSTLIDNFSGLTVNGNITGTTHYFYDGASGGYGSLLFNDSGLEAYTYNNTQLFRLEPSVFSFGDAIQAGLYFTNLTSSRNYYLPDKAGTFALLDDAATGISASTFNNNYLTLTNNTGGTLTTLIDNFTGLTVNGSLSATTYQGLPTDIRVTGGTYSNGSATFTNNTGGTFSVSGFSTVITDVFVTGGTFNNNRLLLTNNTGGTVSTIIETFTGLTVNGTAVVTTGVTTPTLLGGTGTTSSITIQAKSGTGTTGNGIIFKVGSNGATTAASVANDGTWTMGGAISSGFNIIGNNLIGAGVVRCATTANFQFNGSTVISSPTNGQLLFTNSSSSAFTRVFFGVTTGTTAPSIAVSGNGINIVLANNSDFTGLQSLYHRFGSGSPEGVITAPIGCLYSRTDGGAGSSLYVKESGTGNTGWVAK